MVNRIATAAVLILAVLSGCADEASKVNPQEQEAQSQAQKLSAHDTLSGTVIEKSALKIDSICLKLDSGTTFRYMVKQLSVMTQDTAIATTTSAHYYTKNVKSKRSDGSFLVSMRFDSLNMNLDVRNRTTGAQLHHSSFASRDSAQLKDPANIQFASVLGETITLVLNSDAHILEMIGVSSIVNKIAFKMPGVFQSKEQIDQATKFVESMMYTSFIGQQFVPYPTEKLDSSLTWINVLSSPVAKLYTVNSTTKYHITNVRMVKGHRIATVDAVLAGSITPQTPPKEMGISVAIDRSEISGSSHAILDLDNGMTVAKQNHLLVDVTVTIRNKALGKKQTISQKNDSRYEVELLP